MKKNLIIIGISIISVIIIGLFIRTMFLNVKPSESESKLDAEMDSGTIIDIPNDESLGIEITDADAYYEDNVTIISVTDAKSSKTVQAEKDIIDDLKSRGFVEISAYTDYEMDGTFHQETEIDADSKEQHPKYKAYYISEANEFWTLIWINGKIMANPVTYNFESENEVQLVLSEDEKINGYDNYTGKFYETIPDENALIVKVVEAIDKETLDRLTAEEIEKL